MRFHAAVDFPWKHRLLVVPLKYAGRWLWLEMVWLHDCSLYTAVMTEEDYHKMITERLAQGCTHRPRCRTERGKYCNCGVGIDAPKEVTK